MKTKLWILVLIVVAMPCSVQAEPREDIASLLDAWHLAAAADADAYFGAMSEDCVFLGTDAGERWLRDELRTWAEPHFAEAPAWAFTAHDRSIKMNDTGDTAWFEEYLETGMGPCRASGVLTLDDGVWRIRHYDLALTVPNELVDALEDLISGLAEGD